MALFDSLIAEIDSKFGLDHAHQGAPKPGRHRRFRSRTRFCPRGSTAWRKPGCHGLGQILRTYYGRRARLAAAIRVGSHGCRKSGRLARRSDMSRIYEHESDGWKIRFLIANVAPPSPAPAAPAAPK